MAKRLVGSRSKRSKFWSQHGADKRSGVKYDSGFEKKFLEQCYMLGVETVRSKARVPYKDADGKWHHYEPDFYWPAYDYTIEIKGSWAFKSNHANVKEKFHAAFAFFNGRYTLFTEKELRGDYVAKLFAELHNAKG